MPIEQATFGAGCFWGVEEAFRQLPGVTSTEVGYSGGTLESPSYEQVCAGNTGHAEVVRVEYESDKISYENLLKAFWDCHDPTQVNRQGPDVGEQYRSIIFFHTPEQRASAEAAKADLNASGRFKAPIATEIRPAATFYRAEDYHQQYLAKRGQAACRLE